MAKRINATELYKRIRSAHPESGGEWIVCNEVCEKTGASGGRRADAIAMNMWPSRGLAIHGFEIKVSRADWVKEMKNPAKAEAIWGFCDYWWLVVSDRSIVRDDELPQGWGLMVPHGKGLSRPVKATKTEAVEPTRGFMASMLRTALQWRVDRAEIDDRVEQTVKRMRESIEREHQIRGNSDTATLKHLRATVDAFEEASGVKITEYQGAALAEDMGNAFALAQRLIQPAIRDSVRGRVNAMSVTAKKFNEEAEKLFKAFEKFNEDFDQLEETAE